MVDFVLCVFYHNSKNMNGDLLLGTYYIQGFTYIIPLNNTCVWGGGTVISKVLTMAFKAYVRADTLPSTLPLATLSFPPFQPQGLC